MMRSAIRRSFGDSLILALVIALAIVWLAPLFWVIGLSFKPNDIIMKSTGGLLFPPFTLKNYWDIVATSAVFGWMLNSTIVATGQTVLTARALNACRLRVRPNGLSRQTRRFPPCGGRACRPEQAIIVPLHTIFAEENLHNTYLGLIAPRLAVPFGAFLMTQYFRGIPVEIEEAAMLENASRFKIFLRVVLPLTVPAQATLGIYTFLHAWNDYF
jgi:multiple sugar transport system permease protein